MIVDVHAHMDQGFSDIEDLLPLFKEQHVSAIISYGIDHDSNRTVLDLAKKYPLIKAAVGIYPTHCLAMLTGNKDAFEKECTFIEQQIQEKRAIAIGEVGLDYHEIPNMNESQKELMKQGLRVFVAIAKRYNAPIVLHSRKAELDTIELLEKEGMIGHKVLMHCFSGRKHLVRRIVENKWYLSVPCTVVRSQQFQDMVRETPLQQLLTETDAPFLSPTPGERNDARNIHQTIKKIAEIKGITVDDTARILYQNYQKVFL